MTVTVNYATHFPWNRPQFLAPADNRPYAEVVLKGPNNSPRVWCLVDSGADYIQLDRSFANTAGINLGAGGSQSVQTASGQSATLDKNQNTNLDVEGVSLSDTCLFGSNIPPVLGRITFLRAFGVGFDKQGWMRT